MPFWVSRGGSCGPLVDFLVEEAVCALLSQRRHVLRQAGRIVSGWSCLHPSGSAGVGSGIYLWVWKRQPVPASEAQDGGGDLCPPPEFL